MTTQLITANWVEDSNAYVMAYIVGSDGSNLQAADVASLTYYVYEADADGVETVVSGHNGVSLSPIADYIFDTLQTEDDDPRWYMDGGYNFLHGIAYTAFPTGNRKYRYECKIVETGGARYYVRALGRAEPITSS